MSKEEYCEVMDSIIKIIKSSDGLSNNDKLAILETIKLDFMINNGMITIGDMHIKGQFGKRREE